MKKTAKPNFDTLKNPYWGNKFKKQKHGKEVLGRGKHLKDFLVQG